MLINSLKLINSKFYCADGGQSHGHIGAVFFGVLPETRVFSSVVGAK